MVSKLKEHAVYLTILVFSTLILAVVPIIKVLPATGFNLSKIERASANFVYGSTYYSARIKEIKNGHPFIGNPYFIEHRNDLAPAFFVADWIASVPYLIGLSFDATMIFNGLFWSIFFVFLAYFIFLSLGLNKKTSLGGAILSYTQGIFLILPSVSMQTIFPFFLALLLAYIYWVKKPGDQKRIILLALAIAGAVYVYTYLMQVTAVFIFFAIVYFLVTKNFRTAVYLFLSSVLALIISFPIIWYTIKQLTHPLYWETMARIGLVATRIPTVEAFISGGAVMLITILFYVSWKVIKLFRENENYTRAMRFFVLSGLAMAFVIVSNFFTGKELELSGHIERFMSIWTPLALSTYFYFTYKIVGLKNSFNSTKQSAISILFLVSLISLIHFSRVYWSYFSQQGGVNRLVEETFFYDAPLRWLENNITEPSVVMANTHDPMLAYISEYTKHYVLFSNGGILHLVSNNEIEERYLVSRYFDNMTEQQIEQDFQMYAGVGNAVHQHKTHNREVKLCNLVRLNLFGVNCGVEMDAVTFRGKKYFDDLFSRYNLYKTTINDELKKFHVAYILENKKLDAEQSIRYDMRNIANVTKVYEDAHFSIYKIGK